MSQIIDGIFLGLDEAESLLGPRAATQLGIKPNRIAALRILKRSLDARRGHRTGFLYKLSVTLAGDTPDQWRSRQETLEFLVGDARGKGQMKSRPIIVGFGPAGIFAALILAAEGFAPLVIERGKDVLLRGQDVGKLYKQGIINPESNLCFGEGGAGTYSDGKIYTRRRDGEVGGIVEMFVHFGADPEVRIDSRPHIGSNRLPQITKRMRVYLEEKGTEIRFQTRVESLLLKEGRVIGVRLSTGEEILSSSVILATGTSARDMYRHLGELEVKIEAKPFAVGFRAEHPQEMIDRIQFGKDAGHPKLLSAEYHLTTKACDRGVYSFCMCPGGHIVPAGSDLNGVVVNGASPAGRSLPFANAALIATVDPRDFSLRPPDLPDFEEPWPEPLRGLAFQRAMEIAAFNAGGGGLGAPASPIVDFMAKRVPTSLPDGSYRPKMVPYDLERILPPGLADSIRDAIRQFDMKLKGFASTGILVGVETRTSSPLRVIRGEDGQSVSHPGLYPCGEGSGHSGGIVSSALDGIRAARHVLLTAK
jgi:uncharacterized protein